VTGPLRLRHRVARAVATSALWPRGARVAVAVSGGADSMALLDILCATRGMHGGEISVVTIDHGQHDQSARSIAAVVALAERLEAPCEVRAVDLPARASEQACRAARYAVFESLDVDRVALAHHLEDQAETVLLAMIRGSGGAGRSAMPPRRGRYVRPLLDVSRSELRAWNEARGLSWVEDPTNDDLHFLRNGLRVRVLPVLEELRPGTHAALARAARHAAEDERYFEEQLDAMEDLRPRDWPREFVASGPEPLVRRAIRRDLPTLSAAHLDAILSAARTTGGRVALPDGDEVSMDSERVRVHLRSSAVVASDLDGYPPGSPGSDPGSLRT
jgi:tRNA(Ile)-lysidine synthetase-like protein